MIRDKEIEHGIAQIDEYISQLEKMRFRIVEKRRYASISDDEEQMKVAKEMIEDFWNLFGRRK